MIPPRSSYWIGSPSASAGCRVLMVVTFRPEFEPPWTGQAQVTSVTLSRLGQRETKALAGGVAGGKALPVEILDRIIEHTDGIPLCIEELTRTLLEGNFLREERRTIHSFRPDADTGDPVEPA